MQKSPEGVKPVFVDIPILSINISSEDVRTKRSSLNPYPEKLKGKDLHLWTLYHPTSNPLIKIKYLNGEMFEVEMPISYEVGSISPRRITEEPQSYCDEEGKSIGRWSSLANWWPGICEDLVANEASSSYGLLPSFFERALSPFDTGAQLILVPPNEGFYSLYQLAYQAVKDGNWKVGYMLADFGINIGSYEIRGVKVPNTENGAGIFEYSGYDFIADLFPHLTERFPNRNSGITDLHPFNIAMIVNAFIRTDIKMAALEKAIQANTNKVVKDNIFAALERLNALKRTGFYEIEDLKWLDNRVNVDTVVKKLKQRGLPIDIRI